MSPFELFGLGLLGGLAAEVLSLNEFRKMTGKELPKYLRSWPYWSMAVALVVFGGFAAWATLPAGIIETKLVPIQAGLTAPLVWIGVMRGTGDLGVGSHS